MKQIRPHWERDHSTSLQ